MRGAVRGVLPRGDLGGEGWNIHEQRMNPVKHESWGEGRMKHLTMV